MNVERMAWSHMKDRCLNPKSQPFARYGGRGISVCSRWLESFANFYADMGPRPSDGHSLDRVNNDGNYEPSNCRWATATQQARNQSRTPAGFRTVVLARFPTWPPSPTFRQNINSATPTPDTTMMYGSIETEVAANGEKMAETGSRGSMALSCLAKSTSPPLKRPRSSQRKNYEQSLHRLARPRPARELGAAREIPHHRRIPHHLALRHPWHPLRGVRHCGSGVGDGAWAGEVTE